MTGASYRSMTGKKQVTVKVTEQFAKDLNLLFASYGLTDTSYVIRESVAAQAEHVRERMTKRPTTVNLVGQEEENER